MSNKRNIRKLVLIISNDDRVKFEFDRNILKKDGRFYFKTVDPISLANTFLTAN